ncbi:MAG: TfoX/Sxy family protein [Rhodoferax sp.]
MGDRKSSALDAGGTEAPKRVALAQLPNLGPKSQAMLVKAGIDSLAQLRQMGSVVAFVRVKRSGANASLNLLWALEGALSGEHWRTVAREHRTSLLLALDEYERRNPPGMPTRGRGGLRA